MTSALWRRTGPDRDLWRLAERRLTVLETQWTVLGDIELTLAESARLARIEFGDFPFVTSDAELKAAALAEGFPVLP